MLGLFKHIMNGDVRALNEEYRKIGDFQRDRSLGQLMMSNDYRKTQELFEKTGQAISALLKRADETRRAKQDIIACLKLSSSDLRYPAQKLYQYAGKLGKSFDVDLLLYAIHAYEDSLKGDVDSFRNAAIGYRYQTNIIELHLATLNTQIGQFLSYLQSDIQIIECLWELYQKKQTESLQKTLFAALANQISFDDTKTLQSYLSGLYIIKRLLNMVQNEEA